MGAVGKQNTAAVGQDHGGEVNQTRSEYSGRSPQSIVVEDLPRPRYAEKHVFGPQPEVSRGAIRRAYARAAEFCRLTPQIHRDLKVRIMRQALSQSESRLRNRFLSDKRSWIAYGCSPELLPWESVMYSQVIQCRTCGHRFYPESPRHGYECRVCREGYVGD